MRVTICSGSMYCPRRFVGGQVSRAMFQKNPSRRMGLRFESLKRLGAPPGRVNAPQRTLWNTIRVDALVGKPLTA